MTGFTDHSLFLFESIKYIDNNSLGRFLDNLKKEQAIFIITEALKYSQKNGLFDLNESESISKSLRILESLVNQNDLGG